MLQSKFARWDMVKRVAFYPSIFDGRVPEHVAVGTCVGSGSCTARHTAARDANVGNFSATVAHFLQYVDGACSSVGGEPSACVMKNDDLLYRRDVDRGLAQPPVAAPGNGSADKPPKIPAPLGPEPPRQTEVMR